MAATNSAFRTETRDEHLYNHIELFDRSSFLQSMLQQQTITMIAEGNNRQKIISRQVGVCSVITEQNPTMNTFIITYSQSTNRLHPRRKPSSKPNFPRWGLQLTGNSKTMGRRVSSAMIAVLALAFLPMVASLIAARWIPLAPRGANSNFLHSYGIIFSNRRRYKFRNGSRNLACRDSSNLANLT